LLQHAENRIAIVSVVSSLGSQEDLLTTFLLNLAPFPDSIADVAYASGSMFGPLIDVELPNADFCVEFELQILIASN
jgi:hypothetical protein